MRPVHFSSLKRIAKSPAHYRYALDAGFESSRAMDFGTLVHALILGGDVIVYNGKRVGGAWQRFKALVNGADCLLYDGPRKGKKWAEVKADAGDLLIVSTDEYERAEPGRLLQIQREAMGRYTVPIVTTAERSRAQRCADAVRRDAVVRDLDLLGGECEAALTWRWAGRDCAGQLDILDATKRRVTDVKITARAEPEWFIGHALRMDYHSQLDWYRNGALEIGWRIDDCYLLAIEAQPPFCTSVFRLTERVLEEGAKRWRLWMERLRACEESDEWPGYVQSVVDLDVPAEEFALTFGDEDDVDEESEAA